MRPAKPSNSSNRRRLPQILRAASTLVLLAGCGASQSLGEDRGASTDPGLRQRTLATMSDEQAAVQTAAPGLPPTRHPTPRSTNQKESPKVASQVPHEPASTKQFTDPQASSHDPSPSTSPPSADFTHSAHPGPGNSTTDFTVPGSTRTNSMPAETSEPTGIPSPTSLTQGGGNLECGACAPPPLGDGFDDMIPARVPLPDHPLTINEVAEWEKNAGAVPTGNLNTVGFTNTSATDVIEIEAITLNVLGSQRLPEGYCARMPPRGGAGTSLPLEFDFERDESAGRPGLPRVASDEWTFPLNVTPGANIGFEMLGDRPGFVVSFTLQVDFRQAGVRHVKVVGSRETPFRTSSCSAAKAYYVWKDAEDTDGHEVFILTKIPAPASRDPYRREGVS